MKTENAGNAQQVRQYLLREKQLMFQIDCFSGRQISVCNILLSLVAKRENIIMETATTTFILGWACVGDGKVQHFWLNALLIDGFEFL